MMDENKNMTTGLSPDAVVDEDAADPKKPKKKVSRKLRFGTIATVTTAIVVAMILLLNVVMDVVEEAYPLTVDLTSDGVFTLSEDSLTLARGVEQDVEIVVFTGESYFSAPNTGYDEFNTVFTQFYEALRQYKAESGGKVSYTFVDLDANPTLSTRYEAYDVASGSILFLCGDRYQTSDITSLFSYDENTYELLSQVESVLAAKINLVSAAVMKKVTLLVGHEEMADVVSNLQTLLAANACVVEQLDITASAEPAQDTEVFVIPGAAEDYTDEEIARVRGWLHNDGHREKDLVVLVNPVSTLPNLYEMIHDEYGIEVLPQIVCETDANNVYNMNTYYTYADVAETDYTTALTAQRAMMPLTRPLKVHITDSTDESIYAKTLVTFGETAQVQDLATALSEDASTAETTASAAEEYPIVGAAYTTARQYDNDDDRYYTTDVMVFGSAMFAYANTMDITSACNEDLFLSVFRGLTGLESVISISTRSVGQDMLDFGGSLVPQVLGVYIFTIGLPLVLIAIAIVVFVKRRRL